MAFTYRPNKSTEDELEEIKDRENIKTNSKALDHVISWHLNLKSKVKDQEKQIRALQNELFEIKSIIKRKNSADSEYQNLIKTLYSESNYEK